MAFDVLQFGYHSGNWSMHVMSCWKKLWPNRAHFELVNAMRLNGGHEMSYLDNRADFFTVQYTPEDWETDPLYRELIDCVVSCHRTEPHEYRLRGLWVDKAWRGNGIGLLLIDAVSDWAYQRGARMVWAYPRYENVGLFEKAGYVRCSPPEKSETSDAN